MTYCVAIAVKAGIIFCSDSRTNAGIDQISTYSKMYLFGKEGERQFVVMASGNLATTQSVIKQLRNDIKTNAAVNLMNVPSMEDAAEYIGQTSLIQQSKFDQSVMHEANFLVGGQIQGEPHCVMMVYPQGNFITTSKDTPYLQIGESKYGKPILDRILSDDTPLETCTLCALVSMDSTLRSNLTVGPPIEVSVYERDSLSLTHRYRFSEDSDYLRQLKTTWDSRLKEAFRSLPPIQWSNMFDQDGKQTVQQQAAQNFDPAPVQNTQAQVAPPAPPPVEQPLTSIAGEENMPPANNPPANDVGAGTFIDNGPSSECSQN